LLAQKINLKIWQFENLKMFRAIFEILSFDRLRMTGQVQNDE